MLLNMNILHKMDHIYEKNSYFFKNFCGELTLQETMSLLWK